MHGGAPINPWCNEPAPNQSYQELRDNAKAAFYTELEAEYEEPFTLEDVGTLRDWFAEIAGSFGEPNASPAGGTGDGTPESGGDEWLPYDHDVLKSYFLGEDPDKYKGKLYRLAKKHDGIQRSATEEERRKFGKPRLNMVFNRRRIFELTEGRAQE